MGFLLNPFKPIHQIILFIILMVFSLPALSQDEKFANRDSVETIDEGFTGSTNSDIDYDALIKELYGKEEPEVETKPEDIDSKDVKKIRQKAVGPAPGMLKDGFLHGSHLAFSASSPFAVASQFQSWYSFIDASVTLKLPFELDVESIPLYILLEISSFNFENTYPEGGTFAGLSYVAQASAIGDNSGAALGFGFWNKSLGSMLEINYRFRPTTNTFFRMGARGVLITNVDALGATWWSELRLSIGFEL